MTRARRCDPDVHPSAFDFLQNVLMAETEQPPTQELSRTAALRFAMKLQQFSGPVMAKGVEDTAFYRYNRFVALNEVGGAPERFGVAPPSFTRRTRRAPKIGRTPCWRPRPTTPSAAKTIGRGSPFSPKCRRNGAGKSRPGAASCARGAATWKRVAAPDRNDEYMLYQMLVGSWPIDMLEDPSDEQLEAYGARLHAAIEKSLREAKRRSSWAAPDAEYEQATQAFAAEALRSERFLSNFLPFAQRVARLGVENSLAQTVGKLTAPGVPDIYQGCELWDLNLVDPDNRRPVDFALREAEWRTSAAVSKSPEQRPALFKTLMDEWRDGRVKLATIALLLALRREEPELFSAGDYQPIEHRRRSIGLGLWLCSRFGERRLAVADCALPRPSRGGAGVERGGAIAGRPLVRPVSRPLCRRRRPASRVAAIRCPSRCCWPE